jgi:hypothetical protein
MENGRQAAGLTSARPGITLVDALIATTWGILVFGEFVRCAALLAVAGLPVAGLPWGHAL